MPRKINPPPPEEPRPGETFRPAERLLISHLDQLKAISDPLRMRIIESVLHEPLTVRQIASRLKQPPTRLYYHVAELEAAGFLTLVDTRVKSGIIEKYYRVSAENISVDPKLLSPAPGQNGEITNMIDVLFETTSQEISQSMAAGLIKMEEKDGCASSNFVLTRSLLKIRRENIAGFLKKFLTLLEELAQEEEQAGPDSASYGLTLFFYPRAGQSEASQEEGD